LGKGKSLQSFTSKKKEKAEISASKLLLSIFWSKKRHVALKTYTYQKKKPNSVHVYASVGIFVCAFFNTFHTWSSPPEKETTNPPEE